MERNNRIFKVLCASLLMLGVQTAHAIDWHIIDMTQDLMSLTDVARRASTAGTAVLGDTQSSLADVRDAAQPTCQSLTWKIYSAIGFDLTGGRLACAEKRLAELGFDISELCKK